MGTLPTTDSEFDDDSVESTVVTPTSRLQLDYDKRHPKLDRWKNVRPDYTYGKRPKKNVVAFQAAAREALRRAIDVMDAESLWKLLNHVPPIWGVEARRDDGSFLSDEETAQINEAINTLRYGATGLAPDGYMNMYPLSYEHESDTVSYVTEEGLELACDLSYANYVYSHAERLFAMLGRPQITDAAASRKIARLFWETSLYVGQSAAASLLCLLYVKQFPNEYNLYRMRDTLLPFFASFTRQEIKGTSLGPTSDLMPMTPAETLAAANLPVGEQLRRIDEQNKARAELDAAEEERERLARGLEPKPPEPDWLDPKVRAQKHFVLCQQRVSAARKEKDRAARQLASAQKKLDRARTKKHAVFGTKPRSRPKHAIL